MPSCGSFRGSKMEPGLASCVRQGLQPAVIEVSITIENDLVELLPETNLRDESAHFLGRVRLAPIGESPLEIRRERRRGGERLARSIVDDLRVDVPGAAEHAEARAVLGAVDLSSDSKLAALTTFELFSHVV